MAHLRHFWIALVAFAAIFGFVAVSYLHRYALHLRSAAAIYGCFLLLLVLVLIPAFAGMRNLAASYLKRFVWLMPVLWVLPYVVYVSGTYDFHWAGLARLLLLGVLPVFIYRAAPVRDLERFAWQDACVAISLAATLLSHQLAGIWTVPLNLDFFGRLYLIVLASWCWTFVRPVRGLEYDLVFSMHAASCASRNFLYFAAIAIPAGFAIRFTGWNPRFHGPVSFVTSWIELLLFVAVLEELFFRGFLQSLLSTTFGSWWKSQLVVSLLFGCFHILHAPFPNWRYVILASVAGWFYGSAFRCGGIASSAVVHASVDAVWRTWFSRL